MRPVFSGQDAVHRFLCGFLAVLLLAVAGLGLVVRATWRNPHGPGAAPCPRGEDWYLDVGGKAVTEIQDEDLFYHHLGGSIDRVKAANIVLLGPSFVSYAFDRERLNDFGDEHGIKIYNMSFIGIRGGEFSRKTARKWHLHPDLWIINVDDQFVHFFSDSRELTFGPAKAPIAPMGYGRAGGYFAALGRNLRWRLECLSDDWIFGDRSLGRVVYRNVNDGGVDIRLFFPSYIAPDNETIRVLRDSNGHVSPATIATARRFLADLRGRVVFVLVPHSQYCPQQARELADALGVELVLTPDANYTTMDHGGHLDQKGAAAYTDYVLKALEKTEGFRAAMEDLRESRKGAAGR